MLGPKIDLKSGNPLFNNLAWTKAKGVLKEVMSGFYSDPPDKILYRFQLCSNGDIKYDSHGISLLSCDRDTNAFEGDHSNINNTIGMRSVTLEFVDDLLAEHCHRSVVNDRKIIA